jgi:hypothetical protein
MRPSDPWPSEFVDQTIGAIAGRYRSQLVDMLRLWLRRTCPDATSPVAAGVTKVPTATLSAAHGSPILLQASARPGIVPLWSRNAFLPINATGGDPPAGGRLAQTAARVPAGASLAPSLPSGWNLQTMSQWRRNAVIRRS